MTYAWGQRCGKGTGPWLMFGCLSCVSTNTRSKGLRPNRKLRQGVSLAKQFCLDQEAGLLCPYAHMAREPSDSQNVKAVVSWPAAAASWTDCIKLQAQGPAVCVSKAPCDSDTQQRLRTTAVNAKEFPLFVQALAYEAPSGHEILVFSGELGSKWTKGQVLHPARYFAFLLSALHDFLW